MRIACAYAPQIALQSVLRGLLDPQERDDPIALAAGPGGRALVMALTAKARSAGACVGMTVTQARAIAPSLRVMLERKADVEAAEATLQDLALGFAPRLDAESDRVFFRVDDLASLYANEKSIAHAIQTRSTQLGLFVRVAVAPSKGLARVGTRVGDVVLLPGSASATKATLAAAPLAVLGPDRETSQALQQWGIKTVGQLASLPGADLTLRLGAAGTQLHQLANGLDREPFLPRPPADAIEEGTDSDYAIESLEPLSFLLRALLDRVLQRLACRSLACAGLTLRLKLAPRGFDVREIALQSPTRETAILLQLVRLDLERRPPATGVVGLTVMVRPACVRTTQLDLFLPKGPSPERLTATLARLSALVGPEHVGTPRLVDSWKEEQIATDLPSVERMTRQAAQEPSHGKVSGETPGAGADGEAGATLAIHRFRPPRDVEVLIGPAGPEALRGRETTAHIIVAAGPYRVNGEWWSGAGFCREYWDVHASDGALYRIHKDRETSRWYLDGYYD
jgi:protein ImuB